jgi:hypothetical protein
VYSLDSSHIWLITQRSKSSAYTYLKFILTPRVFNRVLLSCIRNLGNCPCPRCLIKKKHIPGLGTMVDGQRRARLRTCDQNYQAKIETARKIIYEKGYVVNSKAVDRVIGSESSTPTRVSQIGHRYVPIVADYVAERIHFSPLPVRVELFLSLCCGPHARIRTWCLEECIYTPHPNPLYSGRRGYRRIRSSVSQPPLIINFPGFQPT